MHCATLERLVGRCGRRRVRPTGTVTRTDGRQLPVSCHRRQRRLFLLPLPLVVNCGSLFRHRPVRLSAIDPQETEGVAVGRALVFTVLPISTRVAWATLRVLAGKEQAASVLRLPVANQLWAVHRKCRAWDSVDVGAPRRTRGDSLDSTSCIISHQAAKLITESRVSSMGRALPFLGAHSTTQPASKSSCNLQASRQVILSTARRPNPSCSLPRSKSSANLSPLNLSECASGVGGDCVGGVEGSCV